MKLADTSLPCTVPLAIPVNWTPEQARAVTELLDELRNLIWAYYGLRVLDDRQRYDRFSDLPF